MISIRKAIATIPNEVKPFFSLMLIIGISGLFFVFGLLLCLSVYSIHFSDLTHYLQNTESPIFTRIIRSYMALQTIALFAIPPFIIAFVYNKKALNLYKLSIKPNVVFILISIAIVVISNPLINYLLECNGFLLDKLIGVSNSFKNQDILTQKLVKALLKDGSISNLCINTIIIAFLPAAFEELFFRGLLQTTIFNKYMNSHLAIISAAFVFSFCHFQFYGFIPRFALGVLFGYMLVWSGSLWITIIMHFINNFMAVGGYFLINHHFISNTIDTTGTGTNWWMAFISLFIISSILFFLYHKRQILTKEW